ncbi:MAG: pilus assembly protein TadG-related protein [Bacillota bacterium]|jgi:hypothetical protein
MRGAEGEPARLRRGERGAAGVLVVLFLPCLLASLGLAIDVGVLLLVRAEMRAAADMGALAGVQDLDFELLAEGRVVIRGPEAVRDAEAWVRENLTGRAFIEPGSVVVSVSVRNLDAGARATCPVTGRELEHPTVCVLVRARVRPPVFTIFGPVEVEVHADASVVGRP